MSQQSWLHGNLYDMDMGGMCWLAAVTPLTEPLSTNLLCHILAGCALSRAFAKRAPSS